MMNTLLAYARLSVTEPRQGMRQVLSLGLDRSFLWPAMVLVAAASALLYNVALGLAPPPPESTAMSMPNAPILLALLMAGGLVLTVLALHYMGRMFGGVGGFTGALTVVVWLQAILLLAQIPQLVLLLFSPIVGNLFGVGVSLYAMWLFVNFVAELHQFKSLGMVFMGIVMSGFAVIFGLSIVLIILNALLGLDLQSV